jgi:hypothetical protein
MAVGSTALSETAPAYATAAAQMTARTAKAIQSGMSFGAGESQAMVRHIVLVMIELSMTNSKFLQSNRPARDSQFLTPHLPTTASLFQWVIDITTTQQSSPPVVRVSTPDLRMNRDAIGRDGTRKKSSLVDEGLAIGGHGGAPGLGTVTGGGAENGESRDGGQENGWGWQQSRH